MENFKQNFIEFMLACQVLRFGKFTTKSGRQTPYFINTGNYMRGSQMQKLGEFYAETIHLQFGSRVQNLFGPAYKGIPLAVAASMALSTKFNLDVSYTFNRKEAKDHGEGGLLVGYPYPKEENCKVVLIEDVTTAGTSVRECLPLIQARGAEVIGLAVSVDRMERGQGKLSALREIQQEFGIETTAIVNFFDLLEYLKKNTDQLELIKSMEMYFSQYGSQN